MTRADSGRTSAVRFTRERSLVRNQPRPWLVPPRDTALAMSQENVEIVRRIYDEGLIDRDPEKWLLELATPDIEYVNPPYAVEPGVRRGPLEVARALRRAHELFAAPRYVIKELFDGGDIVVADLTFYVHGRGSETEAV